MFFSFRAQSYIDSCIHSCALQSFNLLIFTVNNTGTHSYTFHVEQIVNHRRVESRALSLRVTLSVLFILYGMDFVHEGPESSAWGAREK